jgi:hypothetical protein
VIADPDFDLPIDAQGTRGPGTPFLPAPGTRVEGEQVAALLGVRAWLGSEATRERLLDCRSPRILHLATQSGPDVRRTPSVALAGANTCLARGESERGFMNAPAISRLDLQDTEMVVLSACGVADEPRDGEPDLGVRQAFTLAGARTVVTSLWDVPDSETVLLMRDLYSRLLAGQPRLHALRQAQNALRGRHPQPRYWGGFICLGNTSSLPEGLTPGGPRYDRFVKADDPYVAGVPATGRMFVGRNDVLQLVRDSLGPSAGRNILVLRGQRRTGKTSVLRRLQEALAEESGGRYLPVFVDVQALGLLDADWRFFYHLARRLQLDLRSFKIDLPRPSADAFERDLLDAFELDFLDHVQNALGGRQVLLMLDEFEKLKEYVEQGKLTTGVLDFLRHLMQHSPVLVFLIAGTHRLRELTGGYWSVLFNLCTLLDIGPLRDDDALWLINEPVRPWYAVGPHAQEEIIRATGCHPYFIQLVCKKLLEVRNESGLNQMALGHAREAIDRALHTGAENVGYPWRDECSPEQRLVLVTLAALGDNLRMSLDEIHTRLAEAGRKVAVHGAVEELCRRGVLRQHDGRLSFAVPLFQRWLCRHGYDTLEAADQYNAAYSAPAEEPRHGQETPD